MTQRAIPCMFMRGETSCGPFPLLCKIAHLCFTIAMRETKE